MVLAINKMAAVVEDMMVVPMIKVATMTTQSTVLVAAAPVGQAVLEDQAAPVGQVVQGGQVVDLADQADQADQVVDPADQADRMGLVEDPEIQADLVDQGGQEA